MTDGCTLCDLPLPDTAVRNDDGEAFCCRGCRQVHEALADRDDVSADADVEEIRDALEDGESDVPEEYETTFLRIDGMHCGTCETFLESRGADMDGVARVDASYITDTVRVAHDPDAVDEDDLRGQLTGMGYRAYAKGDPKGRRQADDRLLFRLIVGVVFGMMVMLNYVAVIYPTYVLGGDYAAFLEEMLASTSATYFYLTLGLLTSIVLFVTGGPILKGAYVSAKTRQPNMDLLVGLAAASAWAYSTLAIFLGGPHVYYDVTVGIVLVVTAGGYYENGIKRRATDRLADLTEARVDTAELYRGDGDTESVAVSDLEGGEQVLVREGERVPVDGDVASGTGTVDEAVVTGESLPVAKAAGDAVVGGSLLTEGSLVVAVGEGATSSVDRIVDTVWNLQSANRGIQQLADRLATVFVPVVLVLAAVVGTVHFALGASVTTTLLVALTVLIVSCPCALGLATPLAIASSLRAALDRGIVVFDETIFERLEEVDVVVFDKTGTLTTGEMTVLDAEGSDAGLERAALLESRSSHPVAGAIASAFGPGESEAASPVRSDGGVSREGARPTDAGSPVEESGEGPEAASRVADFENLKTGVGGTVDGTPVLVGSPALFAERDWTVPTNLERRAVAARESGAVPVLVGESGTATAIAVVGDTEREGWSETLRRFDDRGVEIVVLTGDDERAAAPYREHDAVDEVFAGVPPEAKAETVGRLNARGRTVMVGDGTNDAPALARADLGIALGSGTAIAVDAADVAILTDDLSSLETVFDLAAAANRRVRQNIAWAFLYNSVAIPLAVVGLINPLFAAAAMAASSLLVVTNSARSLLPE